MSEPIKLQQEELVLHWQTFETQFPTDSSLYAVLFECFQELGLTECRKCGGKCTRAPSRERYMICQECGAQMSFTAGTFFHGVKRFKAWLFAISLAQDGYIVSGSAFSDVVGIAQSSASQLLGKLRVVMEAMMQSDCVSVESSVFAEVFRKRSRETPARVPPHVEQVEKEKECGITSDEPVSNEKPKFEDIVPPEARFGEDHKRLYDLISDEPVHMDLLAIQSELGDGKTAAYLFAMELAKVVVNIGFNYYVINRPKQQTPADELSEDATWMLTRFIRIVDSVFHGISRKYLQLYLAAQWFALSVRRGSKSFLMRCCQFGGLTHKDVLSYVSDLTVKMALHPAEAVDS